MTPAELRFKLAVCSLVLQDVYPGPAAIGRKLGRGPLRSIDGRETRWRRELLTTLGWVEHRQPHTNRYSWRRP